MHLVPRRVDLGAFLAHAHPVISSFVFRHDDDIREVSRSTALAWRAGCLCLFGRDPTARQRPEGLVICVS